MRMTDRSDIQQGSRRTGPRATYLRLTREFHLVAHEPRVKPGRSVSSRPLSARFAGAWRLRRPRGRASVDASLTHPPSPERVAVPRGTARTTMRMTDAHD